jgi:predicted nucleotide-binding protein (sugar kinase/HSP70/actin superfamily)
MYLNQAAATRTVNCARQQTLQLQALLWFGCGTDRAAYEALKGVLGLKKSKTDT